jgi:hypothetical protein
MNRDPKQRLPKDKPGPGRPKGLKNKFPTALKEKVLFAAAELERNGKSLSDEADKDPKWFWEHFVKPMLPKEVNVLQDTELRVIITKRIEKDE